MSLNFLPEYCFNTFDEASADFLIEIGVKGIILDIDNTLEPYENPVPSEHVLAWFKTLFNKGIKASIASNNNKERVELFNKELGLPAYYKSGKPFKKNLIRAMSDMGTSPDQTVLMGDQVFTDVWAAHNAGIRAILVPPIKDKRDLLTRFKRLLERPILRKYRKIQEKGNSK